MRFRLTRHAEEELALRSIPRDLLGQVLDNPQPVHATQAGRKVYQSKLDFGGGRMFLLRAIVDYRVDPAVVITVYRTSKIDKYWR
jgi:hypothetical protein